MRFRPMMKQFFWIFVVDCVILGYCGSQGADAMLVLSTQHPAGVGRARRHALLLRLLLGDHAAARPDRNAQAAAGIDRAARAQRPPSEDDGYENSSPRTRRASRRHRPPAFAQTDDMSEPLPPKDVHWSFEGPFGTYDRAALQRGFQVTRKSARPVTA